MNRRWSTKGLRREVTDRVRELLTRGKMYMEAIVSVPFTGGRTATGEPPRRRTGRLYRSIRMKVWKMPGHGRIVGILEPTAVSSTTGARYPYILEGPEPFFNIWLGAYVGPFPFIRPTFEFMKGIAPEVLGKPVTRAQWGFMTGCSRRDVRKLVV